MEKEHIKMAILKQEQTFRQQVNELHRVYRVQKQLMIEMQSISTQAQAKADNRTIPRLEMDHQQWYRNSGEKKAPEFVEDFDLELTLATGAGRKQEKPSNSDSGATVSSSTSAESESERRFPESHVALRFQNESRGMMISSCDLLALSMFKSEDGMMT
ncbi:hypothetical protein OsI_38469 [Oryza sativa Indica Group]|uniref:Uncharacterized protein n=1 Tax=Oryza sativa subsp. indica TaxID=39946 RepID=A2ZKX6_ORYSI|nr:hypothetical protein OsI_38469 [Oryza sativa Indica Group]